jgi:CRP-like cAMP-binding protein
MSPSSRLRTSIAKDLLDRLAGLPLFAGLAPPLLERLAAASRILDLPGQSRVFEPDEPIRCVHVLLSGSVKHCAPLGDGAEKVLALVGPGEPLALEEAVCAQTHASFAQTLRPSSLLAIPAAELIKSAENHAALGWRLLEIVSRRLYATEFEVVSHHSMSSTQRVLDYLLRLAGDRRAIAGETTVELDANKSLIAARLDMTPETFSRTLRKLSTDGLVVVNGRSIHIQNATLGAGGRGTQAGAPRLYPKMERKTAVPSPETLVNLCGRHRMLSQRLASAWCMLARQLATRTARDALRKIRDQFERNFAQVAAHPLAPRLEEKIGKLGALWQDYRTLLTEQGPDASHARAAFDLSERILAAADRLAGGAARLVGTEVARCVNIAGRNRMLTARVAKLFLFADWNVRAGEARRLVAEARTEFDANFAILSACGAEQPEIAAQLAIDIEQWRALIAIIDSSPDFGTRDGHAREVFAASEELLRHMDTTVKLYERLGEAKPFA